MKQYLDLCREVLLKGVEKPNRTGINTIGIHGAMMKFDLSEGFPAVTTKKLAWRQSIAEMLGFLRGYDNAEDFRRLDCRVWDANANKNKQWLNNPNRKGEDDLGRIYGVQARRWRTGNFIGQVGKQLTYETLDQLRGVVSDLKAGIDNRREIVLHWNPSELEEMALPPCHLLYQFGIQDGTLNLSMYQRSADMPLGVPFNICGYSWLLSVIAKITGHTPGVFTHFLHDVHIYKNQIELMEEQVTRIPFPLSNLVINPQIKSLKDLETWVTVDDFEVIRYKSHPAIKYPFAV